MQKKEPHLQVFNSKQQHIGHFDGEFFYTDPQLELRVDGDEVYTQDIPCKLVGYFRNYRIELLDGSVPYYLEN